MNVCEMDEFPQINELYSTCFLPECFIRDHPFNLKVGEGVGLLFLGANLMGTNSVSNMDRKKYSESTRNKNIINKSL